MRSSFVFVLMMMVSVIAKAQLIDTITLYPVKRIDIVYELPLATLGFNKEDFLKEYDRFKIEYASGFTKDSVAFETAIAFLKTTKKKIILQENTKENQVSADLERLIKMRLAAGLLIQGKAVVTRKGSKTREKEVTLKRYADLKDMPNLNHGFEFVGNARFLSAKLYGRETEMVEEAVYSQPKPPTEEVVEESSQVYYVTEISPEPKGGHTAWKEYQIAQLKYPPKAKAAGIEGKVFVAFWINTDGSLQDFAIAKGLSDDINEEAIRLIKEGPPWKPGKQNGKLVKSRFVLPVTFKLSEE